MTPATYRSRHMGTIEQEQESELAAAMRAAL